MEKDTFPAGLLGTYYAARHEYGLFRSCAVSSYYTFTPTAASPSNEFTQRLSRALIQTIAKHPSLCHGILPASKPSGLNARFKRLSQIAWDDIVSISISDKFSDAQVHARTQEKQVCEEIGAAHEQLFEDQEHKPAWKLRVLMYEMEDGRYRVYILFMAHHAIADGLSCAAFQRTLHEELCLATEDTPEKSANVQWPYTVPETVGKPIFIEDAMDLSPQGYDTLNSQSPSDEKAKQIWSGNLPCMPTIESYKSLVLLVTIPPERVQRLLETSRRLKITVTGYLHGLIVSYLARTTVTNEQLGLKGGTPYSLRRFSKLPLSEIANHISTISTEWNAELLDHMRHVKEESIEEEELIAEIGSQLSQEILAELKRVEVGEVSLLRHLEKVVDFDSYFRESLSTERLESYEISNLGVIRMNRVTEDSSSLRLDGLIFSQCGMVTGAPIGCNVANLEGGPLVISLTWQEGGVDNEVVKGLQMFLETRLRA